MGIKAQGNYSNGKIDVAMFANFLSILALGTLYCVFFVNKSERAYYAYAPDVIRQVIRQVVIGSTVHEIDTALAQCKQFDKDCEHSWYGDELERTVSLQPFALDINEVTVSQFAQFVVQHNYITHAEKSGMSYRVDKPYSAYAVVSEADLNWKNTYVAFSDNFPVVHVTQHDAAAYCAAIDKRLPTEAEWEYIAGGQMRLTYPWGQQWDTSKLHWGMDGHSTKPIASYPPTLLGHYDLAGGVSEWTSTTDSSKNSAFIKGSSRFDTNVANARIPVRRLESIDYAGEDVGFRCAKDLEQWPELTYQ